MLVRPRRIRRGELAARDHRDAIRDLEDLVEILADDQNRGPTLGHVRQQAVVQAAQLRDRLAPGHRQLDRADDVGGDEVDQGAQAGGPPLGRLLAAGQLRGFCLGAREALAAAARLLNEIEFLLAEAGHLQSSSKKGSYVW